jgi:plastocyanin
MKRIGQVLLGVMVLALFLTACSSSGSNSAAGENSPQVESGSVDVQMKNIAFIPDKLTIKVGTKVTWTNMDNVAHDVKAADGSWSSETLNNGQTFSKVFDKTGTFVYLCSFHLGMTGTVNVVP